MNSYSSPLESIVEINWVAVAAPDIESLRMFFTGESIAGLALVGTASAANAAAMLAKAVRNFFIQTSLLIKCSYEPLRLQGFS